MIPTKSGPLFTVLVHLVKGERRVCDYPARAESAEALRDSIVANLAKEADMVGALVRVRVVREVEEGYPGGRYLELDEEVIIGVELKTDPYGALEFAVGTGDDFWCFDYALDPGDLDRDGWIKLHAVINSETGSFIQNAEPPLFLPIGEDAIKAAAGLVSAALDWCAENGVRHHFKGWNQDPAYFVRSVRDAVYSVQPEPLAWTRRPVTRRRKTAQWMKDLAP